MTDTTTTGHTKDGPGVSLPRPADPGNDPDDDGPGVSAPATGDAPPDHQGN